MPTVAGRTDEEVVRILTQEAGASFPVLIAITQKDYVGPYVMIIESGDEWPRTLEVTVVATQIDVVKCGAELHLYEYLFRLGKETGKTRRR